jgi:hypothetical protein
MSGQKIVATDAYVEQAIADMSDVARAFLYRVHRDACINTRTEAHLHLSRLREFARLHGRPLEKTAAYTENITNWRAIARLAGSIVQIHRAG